MLYNSIVVHKCILIYKTTTTLNNINNKLVSVIQQFSTKHCRGAWTVEENDDGEEEEHKNT